MKKLLTVTALLLPMMVAATECPSDLRVEKLIARLELRSQPIPEWLADCASYKEPKDLTVIPNPTWVCEYFEGNTVYIDTNE